MEQRGINNYQKNAIMTASPAELTLMLYDGAIKFCNIAIMAIEKQEVERAHENMMKAENIITELRTTLNRKYAVWEDFDRVYKLIYQKMVDGNMAKDPAIIEEAIQYTREMRDTWKEVMRLNQEGSNK